MNPHELKQLNTRLTKAKALEKEASDGIAAARAHHKRCVEERSKLESMLEAASRKGLSLTEHAILRYLERVHGLNINEVQDKILTEELKAMVEKLGNGKYPIGHGVRAVVRNNAIISIVD